VPRERWHADVHYDSGLGGRRNRVRDDSNQRHDPQHRKDYDGSNDNGRHHHYADDDIDVACHRTFSDYDRILDHHALIGNEQADLNARHRAKPSERDCGRGWHTSHCAGGGRHSNEVLGRPSR
jgi:hypothetical protein